MARSRASGTRAVVVVVVEGMGIFFRAESHRRLLACLFLRWPSKRAQGNEEFRHRLCTKCTLSAMRQDEPLRATRPRGPRAGGLVELHHPAAPNVADASA